MSEKPHTPDGTAHPGAANDADESAPATRTRINGDPDAWGLHGGSGPGASLKHSRTAKQKAAFYVEDHLGPETRKAGRLTDAGRSAGSGGDSGGMPTELKEWEVAAGLAHRQERWLRSLTRLERRLEREHRALGENNRLFQSNEDRTGGQFPGPTPSPRLRSPIDQFIDNARGDTPGTGR
ncbi:hypothetical protein E0L36_04360 [Streptomyces sp. AJS327]|uniref:hypothetical protein n=1 Tax=Streptomyces sp. AJS327 TaxID=2545265 RepID=UPI0015DD667F|nr:hypothetical protein [Streptomyces sp. AJS327]MBA0050157.1 hypothetical protein [Streptomyces sp. AJS327]